MLHVGRSDPWLPRLKQATLQCDADLPLRAFHDIFIVQAHDTDH